MMTNPQDLLYILALNAYTFEQQSQGITHEESLLQLPFRGNCFNWVAGHIVEGRNYMLELLGEERVWSEPKCAPYVTRSEAIAGAGDVYYQWEEIMAAAVATHTLTRQKLESLTSADLATNGDEPLGQQLVRMLWHEAYHLGQTEQLRQLAGKDDHVL